MIEILYLALFSIFLKLLEDCRKIELLKDGPRRLKNVHGVYEAFNAHLAISLAVFTLLFSRAVLREYIYCLLGIVLLGVASKGVFSRHKPERLALADHDARWGLIIPNGCAIAAILVGLLATHPHFFENPSLPKENSSPAQNSTNK